MCMEERPALIEDLNPTFLFTWKGTRKQSEESPHHHDFLEIAFVLSGNGRYFLDGQFYEVSEGDLLVLNPGMEHQALVPEPSFFPATEYFIGFSDVQFRGYPANYLPLPGGGPVFHTTGELRQKLFRLCASIEAENAVWREGRYFMLKSYLMQILLLILREQCEPIEEPSGRAFESANRKYVVEQIVDYLEEHYNEKISLDQIAANMYFSPYYISKIFKLETGDTLIRHLINIRLEKAKELLGNGWGKSIQEVAAAVGYEDAYHFSKLFKKRYGISPSQMRGSQAGK